jgi:hypothetical protein
MLLALELAQSFRLSENLFSKVPWRLSIHFRVKRARSYFEIRRVFRRDSVDVSFGGPIRFPDPRRTLLSSSNHLNRGDSSWTARDSIPLVGT